MARIETIEALRALYRQPVVRAVEKQLTHLDKHCRRFIELSPFLVIGSIGSDGLADVSPRGEGPGFVAVADDHTLLIPDRPGNNRLDTFTNLLSNSAVGLIFLIPGVQETLRVNGHAEIRDDQELRERFVVKDKLPITVLMVRVEEAYLHCAKSILRSGLWEEASRVDRDQLPSMNQMIKDQTGAPEPPEPQDEMIDRYRKVLY